MRIVSYLFGDLFGGDDSNNYTIGEDNLVFKIDCASVHNLKKLSSYKISDYGFDLTKKPKESLKVLSSKLKESNQNYTGSEPPLCSIMPYPGKHALIAYFDLNATIEEKDEKKIIVLGTCDALLKDTLENYYAEIKSADLVKMNLDGVRKYIVDHKCDIADDYHRKLVRDRLSEKNN